jgi:hypothetical protein
LHRYREAFEERAEDTVKKKSAHVKKCRGWWKQMQIMGQPRVKKQWQGVVVKSVARKKKRRKQQRLHKKVVEAAARKRKQRLHQKVVVKVAKEGRRRRWQTRGRRRRTCANTF